MFALWQTFCRNGMEAQRDVPLSAYSTFRIGGKADLLLTPHCEEELLFALRRTREAGVATVLIGNGSNLLFSDAGFRGAVIYTGNVKGMTFTQNTVCVACGESLAALSCAAAERALGGLAFACGIPGLVGGAVYMNAGAYGGEIGNLLVSCRCYNRQTGEIRSFSQSEMAFGYRYCMLQEKKEWVLLEAMLRLQNEEKEAIYAQMETFRTQRKAKQPLRFPSAGSTFKRPPNDFAGRLIESCGLKGYTVGGACVSEQHAGFIVNCGNATAADVLAVIQHVQAQVFDHFGVKLEPEVQIIPERM